VTTSHSRLIIGFQGLPRNSYRFAFAIYRVGSENHTTARIDVQQHAFDTAVSCEHRANPAQ